jgi:carboxyl-terminal processing protease
MSRSRLLFVLLSLALLLPMASGTLSRALAKDDTEEDSLYKHLSVFSEILTLIRRTYVEETSMEGLFAGAMDGTTDALDALATYVPADAVETYARTREIGSARSGIELVKERGIAYVVAVSPGSPGADAELRRGDIIAEIDGRSTRRMPLWEIETIFAGEPGRRIELEVLRRGQSQDAAVELRKFEPEAPGAEEHDDVVVVRIGRFRPGIEERVREILTSSPASEREKLVLDLRGVAGGSAESAYKVADLLVRGELGRLEGREGTLATFAGDAEPVWSGRLVVLTDRGSQGASEVLAAVLQQSAEAELVGERTFGHAGRRKSVELSSGAQLIFTDAFYTGPDGEAIRQSLQPEVRVSDATRNLSDTDVPITDLILRRALELLANEEEPLEKVA